MRKITPARAARRSFQFSRRRRQLAEAVVETLEKRQLLTTYVVDKTVDLNDGNFGVGELTLREAVFLANGNPGVDTINVNVAIANPQFLLFGGALQITESLNIDGTNLNGAGGQSTVNGQANSAAFDVAPGSTVVLADMTIRNGRASNGGGILNAGNLTLSNIVLTANSATVSGGGVYNTGTLTINNGTVVSSNNGSTSGGGVYNSTGTVIINGATLQANATNASGIGGNLYNDAGSTSLTAATLTTGSATDGAGIYNTNTGTLVLTNSTISNNNAVRFGGGIFNTGSSSVTLNSSVISGNSSGVAGSGGGIYSLSGTITVSGSTVTNNRTFGPNGGGIRNTGTLNVTNSTISNNISNAAGGGIYNTSAGGSVLVLNSTISGNQSVTSDGGGIESTGGGTLKVVNSTVSGNTAANRGGGIHAFSGTVVLTNTTITNNHADNDDGFGGIGGGLHLDVLAPNATMNNTIVADNYVGSGMGVEDDVQKAGGTLVGNNNLIGTGGSGGLVNAVNGNQVGVDNPFLGPLANNGGTTLTHALLPISPAINMGSTALAIHPNTLAALGTDQRGGARVIGTSVDVGAFEVTLPLTLVVDKTVDLNDGNYGVGELTLREAVFISNSYPQAYNIVFNVAIANPQFLLFGGALSILDSVNIDGTNLNGAGGQVTINGQANSTVFDIAGAATVGLADMTIRNGRGGNGGGIINAGSLTLSNVVVTANSATVAGGGIFNTGTLTLNSGTIASSNIASTSGGGIYNNAGTVILNGATLQANATSASGIGGGILSSGGSISLTNSTVTTSSATDGAGIYSTASATVTLTNSTLSNNNAVRFGGGVFNTGSSTVILNSSVISGNSSGVAGSGGGIYSLSGTVTLNSGSTVTNNRTFGPNGGGIRNAGTLNVTNSTISNNISNSSGGGIYNTSAPSKVTLLNSTVSGNQSVTSDGGGIENTGGGVLRVLNSTISGNTAANRGGGIHAFSGTVILTNTTITNNRADSDNNATGIGGGLHLDVLAPNATMNNTLVADNFVGAGVTEDDIQKAGGTLAGNNNLIGTGGSGGLVNGVNGNLVGIANPMIGALANNGGATLTHLPLLGSPAIHAGDSNLAIDPDSSLPFASDQRGGPRYLGVAVDIGSVEANVPLTLIVDNTVDLNNGNFGPGNLTLREAVDLANANPGLDTILFNVAIANPIFLLFGGQMGITDSVNIDGTNLHATGGQATINANATSVAFNIAGGTTVGMADMTVRNGRSSTGGGFINAGNLTLSNVVVTANSATVTGGGIHNIGTLTINSGSIISSNNASTTGGGIYNNAGTVIITSSTLTANSTNASGIGGNLYNASGSTTLTNSTVSSGSATDGAGIYNTSATLNLTGSTLSNNNAVRFGGGIFNTGSSAVTVTNSLISGNSSGLAGSGGGIYSLSGTVTVNGSTITNNRTLGPNGGAIRNAGTLNITNSTISNNISNSAGGGIYNTSATSKVTLLNSTVSGNQSVTSDGGGIENTGGGVLRVLNSTISGNTAANRGGGIHAFSGTVVITNATITNNHADNDDGFGGIGGGLHLDVLAPNATVNNTIIADNYVGSGVGVEDDIQKAGGTLAGNNNLIGTGGSGGLVNGVGGNQVGVANPMIGALANNGGPTLTHTLLLGSPAIHAGDSNLAIDPDSSLPFASDQRGGPRYLGVAVDIGSVEVNVPLTLIVDNTVDLNNGNFGPGNLTLREALDLANANPGLDTILFNVGLANPQFLLFSGTLAITDSVNIDGTNLNGAGGQATVNGNGNTQIFTVSASSVVGIADMTVRNGRATNGGAINNSGNLTLTNVLATQNTATLNGGGIYNTGTLTLTGGSAVSNGNASTTGAGIYNLGTLIMNTGNITGNAVSALGIGGGLFNSGGTVNLTGVTITTNNGSDGAGIYNTASGSITLTSSTVSNNSSIRFGGGIFNTNSSIVTLNNSLVTGNSSGASGSGGGIYSLSGTVTLSGSTVSNNRTFGPNGGGIRSAGTLNVTNSTVSGNISNASGGGIYNTSTSGILTIVNSTISGNQSVGSDGGGIESTGGGTLRVINSTISGNTAAVRGGGIHAFSGNVTITNSTITNNRADSDDNASGIGGGLHLDVLAPTAVMNNTIVADNFVGAGVVEDDIQKLGGSLTGNNNLIGTGGSGGLVDAVDGNQVGVADPRLGVLANNGGPTQTHQLLLGSTALQAGSNALAVDHTATPLATDQRGNARIGNGNVDIGAAEFTINLTAPAATNEGATYSLTVGPVVDNSATITDYKIDWGDGNIDTVTALQLTGLGNVVTHVYIDDNPTGTASDPYTITLDVRDAFTSPAFVNVSTKNITVNNVNPVATLSGAPVNGVSGSPINMTGSFTDVGIVDTIDDWTWTVTKNGTTLTTQSGLSTSFSYTPTSPGHYIVSLVATDDDTGMSAAAVKTIHVSGAQIQTDPTDITKTALFVYGTAGNDTILLTKVGVSLVRVTLNSVIIGTFAPTGRVIVQGGTGNDTITDSTVVQHTILYGGEGNDTITANGANDVLVGGIGNDNLVGGNGDDLLIAGDGADSLNGGNDEDLLIGGSTSYDTATLANMLSLYNILNAWSTSGAAGAIPLLLGNVTDDAFADTLTGGSQDDLFYADSVLDITDAILGDTTVAI